MLLSLTMWFHMSYLSLTSVVFTTTTRIPQPPSSLIRIPHLLAPFGGGAPPPVVGGATARVRAALLPPHLGHVRRMQWKAGGGTSRLAGAADEPSDPKRRAHVQAQPASGFADEHPHPNARGRCSWRDRAGTGVLVAGHRRALVRVKTCVRACGRPLASQRACLWLSTDGSA